MLNRDGANSAQSFIPRSTWIASVHQAGSQESGASAAVDRYITLGKGNEDSAGMWIVI